VVIPAALDALVLYPDLSFICVGDLSQMEQAAQTHAQYADLSPRIEWIHTDEWVAMDESPATALRSKKKSSMRLAIEAVHTGNAQACVSAGNTGALVAIARFVLKTLPGIDRPALIYPIPTMTTMGPACLRMLDLGANVDCTAEHLMQFALMGHVLAQAIDGIERPRVALLNIGSEAMKGTEAVRRASELLAAASHINYTGFIEGHDLYRGHVDVVVCDGFVGNVALKSSEGVILALAQVAQTALMQSWRGKCAALLARPILRQLKQRYDPRCHNGASLLGLNGSVIKSHGGADRQSFVRAITQAVLEIERAVPARIGETIAASLT
jgi:glycerol-3-phosphate acyltransferase PlsX